MSKKFLVAATAVILMLLGGCASYSNGYGSGSGSDAHAGHSH